MCVDEDREGSCGRGWVEEECRRGKEERKGLRRIEGWVEQVGVEEMDPLYLDFLPKRI